MAAHSNIHAWRTRHAWTEEPRGLQSMGLQRVRHDWSNLAHWVRRKIKKKKNTPKPKPRVYPPWLLRMDLVFFLNCSVLLSVACLSWLGQSLLRKLEFRVYTWKVGIFVLITGCIPDPSCLSGKRACWPLILSVLTLASFAALGTCVLICEMDGLTTENLHNNLLEWRLSKSVHRQVQQHVPYTQNT